MSQGNRKTCGTDERKRRGDRRIKSHRSDEVGGDGEQY